MLGINAIIESCAAALACPEGIAARGLDDDDATAFSPERLDAGRLNPENTSERARECDRAAPCGVFDGAAPDVSPGLASERRAADERKRFLILSMGGTKNRVGVLRLDRFKSDKERT